MCYSIALQKLSLSNLTSIQFSESESCHPKANNKHKQITQSGEFMNTCIMTQCMHTHIPEN